MKGGDNWRVGKNRRPNISGGGPIWSFPAMATATLTDDVKKTRNYRLTDMSSRTAWSMI